MSTFRLKGIVLKLTSEILIGKIQKRYKRFLADIELDSGEVITVHNANTGSMKTCWEPGWPALIAHSGNPDRKYPYGLEMLHNGETWIGINTARANKIVYEALEQKIIKELSEYNIIQPEKKVGDSRIDFYLTNDNDENLPPVYLEVKNVTLLGENKMALFPDAETIRGQKHLQELIMLQSSGYRAVMFYLVQREDVDSFCPAFEIDPAYADLLSLAIEAGVEVLVYGCSLNEKEIKITHPLEIKWQ